MNQLRGIALLSVVSCALAAVGCKPEGGHGVPARDAGHDSAALDGGAAGSDATEPVLVDDGGTSGDAGCAATEVCGDGLDNDCDGAVDESCTCTPGATQPCFPGDVARAGVGTCTRGTQTCVGSDHGEFGVWGACVGAVLPVADPCDGRDLDCDGQPNTGCTCVIGESQACYTGPAGTAHYGLCREGSQTCEAAPAGGAGAAWGPCTGEVLPRPETCNGDDRDCDGRPNTGCDCTIGQERACYSGPAGTSGVGVCRQGTQSCVRPESGVGAVWTTCSGEVLPSRDVCDGGDQDCDGHPNTGCDCTIGQERACYTGPAGTAGIGICREGRQSCVRPASGVGAVWTACSGEVLPQAERCDGLDYTCTGVPGAGCVCLLGATQACYTGPAGTAGVGQCLPGSQTCVSTGAGVGWSACQGDVLPSPDVCDGVDHDCDGTPNTGCACTPNETRTCYTGPAGTVGVGACRAGAQVCQSGPGGAGSSWAACSGETLPVTEVCGNAIDDDCDGQVDETCQGSITCPADAAVPAGRPLTLTATATGITGLSWSVLTAPNGGSVTWSPAPPTSLTEELTPFIVGTYVIRVSGRDPSGATQSCTFNVVAMPHGLRVQLRWDGTGDVDLHMHNQTTTPWFNSDDCYYANRNPTWGAGLDVDNTSSYGPENIRVDVPVIGNRYTVGVHNYSRAAGRIATIEIYCGDTSMTPVATFVSRALTGTEGGNSTSNDFWKVADVVFSSESVCAVTPIDTYQPSSQVNVSF